MEIDLKSNVQLKQKTVKSVKTLSGEPSDEVIIDPDKATVDEAAEKTAVFTFGRFNPPTVGHEKLINKVHQVAKEHGATGHVFASHSEGTAKDPLPQKVKVKHLMNVAPEGVDVHGSSKEEPSFLHAAKKLHDQGHQHLVMVAGSDRVDAYKEKLNQYNGKEGHYHFKSIKVVSAGQRDPDAEGVSGMSGTKMRAHARAGRMKEFKSGLPKALHPHAEEIANHIRGIKEEVEQIDEISSDLVKKARDVAFSKGKDDQGHRFVRKAFEKGKKESDAMAKKMAEANDLPFTPDKPKKKPSAVAGKYGQGYSTARHLARQAMQKYLDKNKKDLKEVSNELLQRYKKKAGAQVDDPNTPSKIKLKRGQGHLLATVKQMKSGKPMPEETQIDEALGYQQRLKRAVRMRRNKNKIARARSIARRRLARNPQLRRRALKKAKMMVRRRLAGQRGAKYSELSTAQKISIDTLADKKKALVAKIATRIMPRVKRAELQRLSAVSSGKKAPTMKMPMVAHYEISGKEEKYLMEKAEASNLPYDVLRSVFMRGKQAYKNQSVPGQTQSQYAFSRLASFLNKGKAYKQDDKDLVGEAKKMKGEDPCWDGYEMVGTKKKNGKEVPNCVPKE